MHYALCLMPYALGETLGKGFDPCNDNLGVPSHEKRFSVRLRLLPCITDLTQIAIAEDSFGNLNVFLTFLIHEQNRSDSFLRVPFCPATISSTLLEEWILTVLHM